MPDYDLTHPLVLGVFTAAVSTAAIMGWLTISNVLTWRAIKARELAVYASFTGGGAALATAVAATFVPMGASARIVVFRLVWAFSCGALGAWLRAIPRFVGVRSRAADRVGIALYVAVAIPLLDIVAGALGHPFFLLPGPRASSSILVAAAGNTYHHSALADAVGGVLAITTIIGAGLLLKAISDSGRAERVLTVGVVLTVVAGIVETGMAVTDARFMAPLIFAAYLVEAMRITFSSNRSVVESLAESRQAQASQRALIAEQLDRLAAAQRLAEVGSETARLSHDIRNPLAAADVTLELVQELADDISQDRKDEIVELVGLTRDALGTGLALVNRITERARLPEQRAVDVRQLVRDSRAMCGHRLEGVQIRTELPDEPVYVQGDPVDLTQVVVNLLVNAALATESLPERWIRLLVEPEDGFVRIDVQDAGTTPAPDVRRAMFTRGFTTRADTGGSGLGLDICARVIEAHGGAISLDETAEHTTFQVLLPGAGAAAALA